MYNRLYLFYFVFISHIICLKKIGSVRFLYVFERSLLCSPRLQLFVTSTVKTIILWNPIITKQMFSVSIYFKCNILRILFFAETVITPVFSVTSFFGNHSNMLIWCLINISAFKKRTKIDSLHYTDGKRMLWLERSVICHVIYVMTLRYSHLDKV